MGKNPKTSNYRGAGISYDCYSVKDQTPISKLGTLNTLSCDSFHVYNPQMKENDTRIIQKMIKNKRKNYLHNLNYRKL